MEAQDLTRFEAELRRRRDELRQRAKRVERDLTRADEPLSADFADQAVQRENDETLEAIGAAARQEVQLIDRALARIAQGRYGVCEICDQPISLQRLSAVPYAARCTTCG